MKKYFFSYFIFGIWLHTFALEPYKALVIVPVADLVGEPILATMQSDIYDLPISGVGTNGCSRIHQIIFNETVTVLEEHDNEIRISISNIFFEHAHNETRFTEYWTHKQAVIAYESLKKDPIPLTFFPEPVDFNKNSIPTQETITLLFPYYDLITQQTYSAGTRFVLSQIRKKNFLVYAYCPINHKVHTITLPQHLCLLGEPKTEKDKISLFTSLVQQWAQQHNEFIPYVRGGCSFTTLCKNNNFIKKENAYYRPAHPNMPTPGLDCTGLIVRATQICGIPYYFKNSTTLIKYLHPVEKHEAIEDGDIIWFEGHAIIIADVSKDLCVEARSYDHGFGKIHALPINKLFAHMHHLEDIKTAMFDNKPVVRLDSAGNHIQIIPTIKILKLSSVWRNQQKKHTG